MTKVASRYVVGLGAGVLLVLGLASKVGGVIATSSVPRVGRVHLARLGTEAERGVEADDLGGEPVIPPDDALDS